MPEWLVAVLPGVLAGVASALGSMAAVKVSIKGLIYRVGRLEAEELKTQRDLGRIEGRLCSEEKEGKA